MLVFARYVFALLIFLGVGEAVVRFDRATLFFGDSRAIRLENRPHTSETLLELQAGTFVPADNQYRVIVLGDSYLHGKGIPESERFVARLKEGLETAGIKPEAEVCILDMTVPGHNTSQNAKRFFEYADRFQPDALVWAYFINDVYVKGKAEADPAGGADKDPGLSATGGADQSHDRVQGGLRSFQKKVYENVRLLKFVIPTISKELKLRGVVVPYTQFYHECYRSHEPDYKPWLRTQAMMDEVWQYCSEQEITALVLNCPYLNLLNSYSMFDQVDSRIGDYFGTRDLIYVRGADCFLDFRDRSFSVSKYDSHPNASAHAIFAEVVTRLLSTGGKIMYLPHSGRFDEGPSKGPPPIEEG